MTDELNELETELDEALADDEIKDEDFEAPAESEDDDDAGDDTTPVDEPEPEPEPEPQPLIDDREEEQKRAAEVAGQWQAYLDQKQANYEAIKAKLVEADDLDTPASERVALQEQMADAMLDIREAKKSVEQAEAYRQQVSQPRPQAMQDWMNRNPRYRKDTAFKARVDALSHRLFDEEGMNPSHQRFYAELDKQLMQKKPLGKPGKRGAAPVRRTSQAAGQSKGPTAFDKYWMPKIGRDPNVPKDLAEWNFHKRELAMESR